MSLLPRLPEIGELPELSELPGLDNVGSDCSTCGEGIERELRSRCERLTTDLEQQDACVLDLRSAIIESRQSDSGPAELKDKLYSVFVKYRTPPPAELPQTPAEPAPPE